MVDPRNEDSVSCKARSEYLLLKRNFMLLKVNRQVSGLYNNAVSNVEMFR
jgi:hypothetical protein